MPSNKYNVIGDGSDSDSDIRNFIASVITPDTPDGGKTTPFHVPHLYWKCATDGKANSFPVKISVLLDHGSHAVFISEQLIDSLGLRHCQLPKPETVKMAMQGGTTKTEFVL
jgi:hypothetical protein